jgi:hypothetical protein
MAALTWPTGLHAMQDALKVAAPDLQVEFLGCEKGFAVGAQSVTMLCVIRNAGTAVLPENSARVRCYPLTGLDFMEGQLWPTIPALNPNQAVAFRWRLAVTDQSTPLVFSVLISKTDRPASEASVVTAGSPQSLQGVPDFVVQPKVIAVPIPRFAAMPHLLGVATAAKTPQASAGKTSARVGNDRTMVNVLMAQDRVPLLSMAGKEGTEWRSVAIASPCLRVRSAEEGQTPWSESFRVNDIDARETKDSASITLNGSVGANWGASLNLESRMETGVIYGRLRLTARRGMRLYGVQLPRLLGVASPNASPGKADGSPSMLSSDETPIEELDRVAASHIGGLTYGITWPGNSPLTGWRSVRFGMGDTERLPVLGAEWTGDDKGQSIDQGATIEMPFRIFVFGPSDTVRDAGRFRIP